MQTLWAFALGASSATLILQLWRRFMAATPSRATASRQHPSNWKPGDPQPAPFDSKNWVQVDPATFPKPDIYALTISAVVPRPVGFISSISKAGLRNLSPYSYFNVLAHNPPMVALGCCRSPARKGGKKDTLVNIEDTGEFVVNIISDWFVEAANHCCGEYPPEVDEMEVSGLTPVPSVLVKPPRVAESAVQLECKLRHIYEVKGRDGNPTAAIVLGEVVVFHIHEGVAGRSPSGKLIVDPLKLRPISRLGGVTYAGVPDVFDLTRPNAEGNYPANS